MFTVTIKYVEEYLADELREFQEMFSEIKDFDEAYDEACSRFDNSFEIDELVFAWATELGWNGRSYVQKMEEEMHSSLYNAVCGCSYYYDECIRDAYEYIRSNLQSQILSGKN